jgi:GAF domain-containing protein
MNHQNWQSAELEWIEQVRYLLEEIARASSTDRPKLPDRLVQKAWPSIERGRSILDAASQQGLAGQDWERDTTLAWVAQIHQLLLDLIRIALAENAPLPPNLSQRSHDLAKQALAISETIEANIADRVPLFLRHSIHPLNPVNLEAEDAFVWVMNETKMLTNADRSTLWLLDEEKDQIWTKIQRADGTLKEIRLPKNSGFAGLVVQSKELLLIPFDAYNDERIKCIKLAHETDRKTGYRTCSILCMPLNHANEQLIGVIQLINKTKLGEYPPYNPANYPAAPEQWRTSFTQTDREILQAFNTQVGVALQNAKLLDPFQQQEQEQNPG